MGRVRFNKLSLSTVSTFHKVDSAARLRGDWGLMIITIGTSIDTLRKTRTRTIELARNAPLGITEPVKADRAGGARYVITHRASGWAVAKFRTIREARKALKYCLACGIDWSGDRKRVIADGKAHAAFMKQHAAWRVRYGCPPLPGAAKSV